MALPKLNNAPNYEMVIPSTKKTVRYRPFLVKEQKALMLASESNQPTVMFRSVLDLLISCIEDKVYEKQLTSFDVEYMFLQLRAKSVGETAEISIACSECDHSNGLKINLEDITIEVKDIEKKIDLTDDIKVHLKYPSYLDMINTGVGDGKEVTAKQSFDIMHSCVEAVETPDEKITMTDVDKKEVEEFIDSMNTDQFGKLQEFISTMPKLDHKVKFKCKECGHDNEILVEGISSFL